MDLLISVSEEFIMFCLVMLREPAALPPLEILSHLAVALIHVLSVSIILFCSSALLFIVFPEHALNIFFTQRLSFRLFIKK